MGVMSTADALKQADENGVDLVEVAPNATPPVCRIMDYGRYKYEQKKKRTGKNKQGHAASLKEVKLRPGTDTHDLEFKLGNARRFLMDGDKVKVTVMFRGREMVHRSRGRDQLDNVTRLLAGIAKVEIYGESYAQTQGGLSISTSQGILDIGGFDLKAIKITNQAIAGPKPVFVLMAGLHARELPGPEIAMYFVDWLTDG